MIGVINVASPSRSSIDFSQLQSVAGLWAIALKSMARWWRCTTPMLSQR
ncbi:MAG: hypothetical protein HC881_02675 [Leptolyngbyaceae cyanobacterium SL_7_1]|nr:hypothetical protein [Leptolyngbyaceae cyanobacterium SL_7_1]